MVTTMRDRLRRVRTYATTRILSTALVLLGTPIALAVPAAADPAVTVHPELTAGITGYHLTGNESFQRTPSAPIDLAGGAAATGGFTGRNPELAFSTRFHPSAPNDLAVTLGAGSRLFGSHVPVSPVDGSSLGGSSGLTGVLTLASTGTVAATGAGQPPLPPYGRRATWTFRTPLTRPG